MPGKRGEGPARARGHGCVPVRRHARTVTYSELNSFYLLVDRPSVYGLPETPVNPWLQMKGDYVRAIVSGLVSLAFCWLAAGASGG